MRIPQLVKQIGLGAWLAVFPVAFAWGDGELVGQDHELAGRIWDVGAGTFVEPAELEDRAARAEVLLLGESHDNPVHHRHQARLLKALAETGRRPTLVLEMVPRKMQSRIDDWQERGGELAALGEAVQWEARGWPPLRIYAPVFRVASDFELPIRGGNLDRDQLRSLVRQPDGEIPPGLIDVHSRFQPTAEQRERLQADIREAHCGLLPDSMIEPMTRMQRLRDAALARTLEESDRPVVLLAGSGHVRIDTGVPAYLEGPGRVAVAFAEVRAGKTGPNDYASAWGAESPPFDYLWFTPRKERGDPCKELKKRMDPKGHRED